MIGKMGKRLTWSEQLILNEKPKKDHDKSHSLVAFDKDLEKKDRRNHSIQWDLDVQPLISSVKWLQLHGLKKNKMTFSQILSQIGFRHKEDYVSILGKLVASRYANGLYRQFRTEPDGKLYKLTAKKDLLVDFVDCLTEAIELYKQRMEWLTTESRQIFGVIQEQSITIVMDFGVASRAEFDLCREALSMVIRQQVIQITKFNLIQGAQDFVKWQDSAVPVTEETIEAAIEWLWMMDHVPAVCHTGPTEALLEALFDDMTEAVYYFVVGDMLECTRHLLLEKISQISCPVHSVSFNAREEDTITFLKELSQLTTGRFHAFAERTDYVVMMETSVTEEDEKYLTAQNSRKLKGSLPIGTGVREDVYLIWKELEEARNALTQVQRILIELEQSECVPVSKTDSSVHESNVKIYVNSKEWLQKNGLKAQKLTISRAFADSAFRHVDGIVDIKTKPQDESLQTDAEANKKIIHAKYCDGFLHTVLEDGSIIHIHLDDERCKQYEEQMKNALNQMERRLQELKKGSRALFGDIKEDHIYVLIDTSESMKEKLPVVKQKLFQLIEEQVQNKTKFNLVKFDVEAVAWKEKLAEVNEHNLEDALSWIEELQVGGSTNTLQALQVAFCDPDTQAIYLLTDGRPDQPPNTILAQLKLQRNIPVHTISFNCDDTGANKFLHEVASETGGRFHYYHIRLRDPDAPKPFECEDIYLLKKEIEQGEKELKKIQTFRTGKVLMDLFNGAKDPHDKHRRQHVTVTPRVEGMNPPSPNRPHCASEEPASASPQPIMDGWQARFESPDRKKKALHAEQTKSSMLRSQRYSAKSTDHSQNGRISPERKEQKAPKMDKKMDKDLSDISSARWLKTHGLVAKRLTIMDALAPTAIPRTTKYIPSLDKHVVSRVFDDVLPFAHVSSDKKCVTLINPQAVDLDAYKKRLKEAIKTYERRLDQIVWRALPQEEKEKFEQGKPVSYVDHKESLLEALENAGWPITYEDVMLLEEEILIGLTYLQQAIELQEASREETQRICPLRISPPKEVKKQPKGKMIDALKGRKVIARSESTGFYYPGTAIRSITPFYALVDFLHGHTEIVPIKFIIAVGGAMPCPSLQVGDYVFVRIRKTLGDEYYVPGVVIATPRKTAADDKLFTVLKYNNRKEYCVRNGLIKISYRRYTCSCCYINMTRMMNYLVPNVKVAKHFHRGAPAEERGRKTIAVGGDYKKVHRKGRTTSKKEYLEAWASSDSDEELFPPSRTLKRRESSSSPPPHVKDANAALVSCGSPHRNSLRGRKQRLSSNASEYRLLKNLCYSHEPSGHQKSVSPLVSKTLSSISNNNDSRSSSNSSASKVSLSSIEKVEELARRLQQYHIAQRKGHPTNSK
ncbi:von Willebrand factor A domain-containing protein 3B isoform X2 [Anolis carolinensis]|nr:PREDICTED: von Willebrand factor A domain-containing protein 3B [Anolis carolinensis]|eukprot:XP_008105300.2 PREDICTED: von Willebrand factor A domain-containing protein 3B [Anolis carolinensis]